MGPRCRLLRQGWTLSSYPSDPAHVDDATPHTAPAILEEQQEGTAVSHTDSNQAAASDASNPPPSNGPSRRVVTTVALVVAILTIVVGVLRMLGVGAPYRPPDSGEGLDAAAEIARRQQAESDVQAYVYANDPLMDPSDSIVATCTPIENEMYSCSVLITGYGLRTDSMSVSLGSDGTWTPVDR
jgi:hypothetical protein